MSYPPALKNWVEAQTIRAQNLSEGEQNIVNAQIREIITGALKQEKTWLNNWPSQKLPYFDGGPLELYCNRKKSDEEGDNYKVLKVPSTGGIHNLKTLSQGSNGKVPESLDKYKWCMTQYETMIQKCINLHDENAKEKDLYIYLKSQLLALERQLDSLGIVNLFIVLVLESRLTLQLKHGDIDKCFCSGLNKLCFTAYPEMLKNKDSQLKRHDEFVCILGCLSMGDESQMDKVLGLIQSYPSHFVSESKTWLQHLFSSFRNKNYHNYFVSWFNLSENIPMLWCVCQDIVYDQRRKALDVIVENYEELLLEFMVYEFRLRDYEVSGFLTRSRLEHCIKLKDGEVMLDLQRFKNLNLEEVL